MADLRRLRLSDSSLLSIPRGRKVNFELVNTLQHVFALAVRGCLELSLQTQIR
jgi:hypothetical protein